MPTQAEERLKAKVAAAKIKAENTAAKEAEEANWMFEMSKLRRGMRDVRLEHNLECTVGKGRFGGEKWSPRYAVYNTQVPLFVMKASVSREG